jgi:hypothetical protein
VPITPRKKPRRSIEFMGISSAEPRFHAWA